MGQPLPGPLAHLAPLLDRYGYAAVALLVLAEGLGIPTPAVTILVTAAVYAGAGHLNLAVLAVIAVAAASAGDNLGYIVGRKAGKPAVLRWGRYVRLTPARIQRAEGFLTRRAGIVVPVARFIDGLRQTNGLIAGAICLRWPRYLVLDAVGAVLWAGAWMTLGYLAGDHIALVYGTARRYQTYAILVVAVVVAVAVGVHLLRRHRRGRRADAAPLGDAGAERPHSPAHVGREAAG
jgi:membrane protein DedA with SNARE-associated domain